MIRLMYVETGLKREMRAFFCAECNALFEECPFWAIDKTLAMHLRGSGHRRITFLKRDEVDDRDLRFVGMASSPADYLSFAQGKPQSLDVKLYEAGQ